MRKKTEYLGFRELHGILPHDKHIAMLMKINADLDKVGDETMKLLQEVHS
ncbi:MAG: hypothetical protein ABI618_02060 [Nitrospirota bacterium]